MAASVLAHALVVAVLVKAPLRPPVALPEKTVIAMRLLPSTVDEKIPPASQPSPPEATLENKAETETQAETQPASEATPEPVVPAIAEEPSGAAAPANDESTGETDPERAATLRARLLEQVRVLSADAEDDGGVAPQSLPWTPSGTPVAGLPGVRGWISSHVGQVTPSAHAWKNNDGSSGGRYVMTDGTVVCTHRRAPTIDEIMNPWKSTVVTLSSICGRERPPAPDYNDPRVQPPPSAVRGPTTNNE